MFEHLKDQASLSWRHRLTYLLASASVVSAVFLASLWVIGRTAVYFDIEVPFFPVRVHYDVNEDGLILNEILDESTGFSPAQEAPETVSPPR
jgi:hypothetical protein